METGMAGGADTAMSQGAKTRVLAATGLLLMEALGVFRGTRKTGEPAHPSDAGQRT